MINQMYRAMLGGKSIIRVLSENAIARGEEIGYENVFDYTLGNPSVPTSPIYTEAIIRMHREMEPVALHGYSQSLGIYEVRSAVAESLNRRFDMDYQTRHIFMTNGAASSLAHAIRAVTEPGDEVLVFAPYFPEYYHYINKTGAVMKVVPANTENFQVNFAAFEEMLTDKVAAVLINSPNNPSGAAFDTATLTKLADLLYAKQEEYGHDIFLISDEPYREIIFNGADSPYVSKFYDNTLSCYSFSKSLSLPGERIGYVAVNPRSTDADIMAVILSQISRGIGHNCPSSSVMRGVMAALDTTSDLSVYETNMNLLYNLFTELGFEVVKPSGTFYIFPKCLEEDASAFCFKAAKYDLYLVPSDNFGVPGYFRAAYCIDTEKVKRSLPVFRTFVEKEYGRK